MECFCDFCYFRTFWPNTTLTNVLMDNFCSCFIVQRHNKWNYTTSLFKAEQWTLGNGNGILTIYLSIYLGSPKKKTSTATKKVRKSDIESVNRMEIRFDWQNALIQTINTCFLLQNNLCEFTTRKHKLENVILY